MEPSEYLNAIQTQGRALLAAVDRAPDARVEHCPDWDSTGLADHMRNVWGFMAAQVSAASPDRPARPDPDDASTVGQTLDALLALLTGADPTAPAWNWCPEEGRTVAWIGRRMAHETAIHRWDAENAAGHPSDRCRPGSRRSGRSTRGRMGKPPPGPGPRLPGRIAAPAPHRWGG